MLFRSSPSHTCGLNWNEARPVVHFGALHTPHALTPARSRSLTLTHTAPTRGRRVAPEPARPQHNNARLHVRRLVWTPTNIAETGDPRIVPIKPTHPSIPSLLADDMAASAAVQVVLLDIGKVTRDGEGLLPLLPRILSRLSPTHPRHPPCHPDRLPSAELH